ncbi:MAG: zf-HC2 domain-containing protein [Planctomycetota bacterium]
MNCDRCQELLSAWLDEELADDELQLVESHQGSCATCQRVLDELRDVEMRLRKLTLPVDAITRAEQAVASHPTNDVTPQNNSWRSIPWLVAALAASILFLLAILDLGDRPAPVVQEIGVARLVRSTGELEAFDPVTEQWRLISAHDLATFSAGTRLRTLPGVVCELETSDRTTLRLDASAEVVLLAPSHVQVVEGQIWGCVAQDQSLKVDTGQANSSETTNKTERPLMTLSCSSGAEWQWANKKGESVIQSLADASCQLTIETFQCPVNAKEQVSVSPDLDVQRESANVQSAKIWQIPLLAVDQTDSELEGVLESLLIQIGSTKAGFFQEQQVRRLGPAGAIPLLAYVQSARSLSNRAARGQAMRIASETADETGLNRLRQLSSDEDQAIAKYAKEAIERINREQVNREQREISER